MTQAELDRAVAHMTGESVTTVEQLGFGPADPVTVSFDPEPYDLVPNVVDWDDVDAGRDVLFPVPQRADLCLT